MCIVFLWIEGQKTSSKEGERTSESVRVRETVLKRDNRSRRRKKRPGSWGAERWQGLDFTREDCKRHNVNRERERTLE